MTTVDEHVDTVTEVYPSVTLRAEPKSMMNTPRHGLARG